MITMLNNVIEKLNNLLDDTSVVYLINDDTVSANLVITALQTELHLSFAVAQEYMMQAHKNERCLIYKSTTENCKDVVAKLQRYNLTLTIEKGN